MSPQIRRRPSTWSQLRRERLALLIGAVVLVPVAAWGVTQLANDESDQRDGVTVDPGVAHVHGLGINPADGSLIVATHYGSFRIPSDGDDAERIGNSLQDTMGFTVAGPDHFLGSGHPDFAGMQAGQPGQLGLIESTDGGATWASISLSGEVDFHGLAFAHDLVYGWDSGTGRFMVSADSEEWETRSTLAMYDFAVDPKDPDHLVGATPDGSVASTDGGRTWNDTDGPPFLAVSWDAHAGLWGADERGGIWSHTDGHWERVGLLPGQPQALLATPDGMYAAAHDNAQVTGIYRSTDDGRSWDLRYRDGQQ